MARHNLGTIVSFEVIRTLTKRRFWIATLIVPVVIGIVIGLVVVSTNTTNSRVNSQKNAKFTFTYSDASGYVDPAVVAAFGGSKASDPTQAIAAVKAGKLDAYFAYPSDPVKQPTLVYGVDAGIFDNGKYSSVATQILVASAQTKIGDTALTSLVQGTTPRYLHHVQGRSGIRRHHGSGPKRWSEEQALHCGAHSTRTVIPARARCDSRRRTPSTAGRASVSRSIPSPTTTGARRSSCPRRPTRLSRECS